MAPARCCYTRWAAWHSGWRPWMSLVCSGWMSRRWNRRRRTMTGLPFGFSAPRRCGRWPPMPKTAWTQALADGLGGGRRTLFCRPGRRPPGRLRLVCPGGCRSKALRPGGGPSCPRARPISITASPGPSFAAAGSMSALMGQGLRALAGRGVRSLLASVHWTNWAALEAAAGWASPIWAVSSPSATDGSGCCFRRGRRCGGESSSADPRARSPLPPGATTDVVPEGEGLVKHAQPRQGTSGTAKILTPSPTGRVRWERARLPLQVSPAAAGGRGGTGAIPAPVLLRL